MRDNQLLTGSKKSFPRGANTPFFKDGGQASGCVGDEVVEVLFAAVSTVENGECHRAVFDVDAYDLVAQANPGSVILGLSELPSQLANIKHDKFKGVLQLCCTSFQYCSEWND